MKVESVYVIKGHGPCVTVRLEANGPQPGDSLVRVCDRMAWTIRAIEWWCLPRRPGKGDNVGLLLDRAGLEVGDVVEIYRAS